MNSARQPLILAVLFYLCGVSFCQAGKPLPAEGERATLMPVYTQEFQQPSALLPGPSQQLPLQPAQPVLPDSKKVMPESNPGTLPSQMPFIPAVGIFDSLNGPVQDADDLEKTGEFDLAVVSDQHIQEAKWIFADFSASGQGYAVPAVSASGEDLFEGDWSAYAQDPSGYALRFLTAGAGNTFELVIEDDGGKQIRFPIAGEGGILGGNSYRNQVAIASFDWLVSKAPEGFNWSAVQGFGVEATQPGWTLLGDIQVVEFNEAYDISMGIAGHDLQGPGWRQRLDNYQNYFGQEPSVGTFFTTIFEPVNEKRNESNHYSDIYQRSSALQKMGVVPAVTLEFRSWGQITGDQEKISAERERFNEANAGGIAYDEFISQYVSQNRVLDAVNEGKLDPLLKTIASSMGKLKSEVYLRLFHEPYSWFPWGMREESDVQKFRDAWVHVGQIFEQEKASNVKFVMTLDPFEPGGASWSEVTAIPSQYLSAVELDAYTDPYFRQNANLTANELLTKKLTEIDWQLKVLYPDVSTRPTIALGEFAFSGGDYFSKEQAYSWFTNDLIHGAYPVNRFSVLNTYLAGPAPSADALNYSPPQENYWSAAWQPESPWYDSLLAGLQQTTGLWEKMKK